MGKLTSSPPPSSPSSPYQPRRRPRAPQLSANQANLSTPYLNSFALTYALSRAAYNVIYYTQTGFWTDALRTGVYVGGMFGNLWVLWKSAGAVAR